MPLAIVLRSDESAQAALVSGTTPFGGVLYIEAI